MDSTVVSYVVYLLIAASVTVWVARTLSRNGRLFLADVFAGDEKLADAVNHLLVVGFYLVNLGFVALWMRNGDHLAGVQDVLEALSYKLGTVFLLLGVMHLGNVYVLNRLRRRSRMPQPQPQPYPHPYPGPWGPPAGA